MKLEDPALRAAVDALHRLEQGQDLEVLRPIAVMVRACHKDPTKRARLETALEAVLRADGARVAKDYACRALSRIGTRRSVETLAALLVDPGLSHMARYALERIPSDAAGAALRNALSSSETTLLIGGINSLGARRETSAVPKVRRLLDSRKRDVVEAAVAALGEIGGEEAAEALRAFHGRAPRELRLAIADALLVCAERLTAGGEAKAAQGIYEILDAEEEPRHVRRAAARRRVRKV